jgi:hypothetical protein
MLGLPALAIAAATAALGGGHGFSANVDNPWFPLKPGTTFRYEGVKDGKPAVDLFTVTHRVKRVNGAPCREIHDRLFLAGKLEERTTDWYSQDGHGTVWYFGESTMELDSRGHIVTREGSWRAGSHGARPGVFMPARPRVRQTFAQEHFAGHAEDHFKVLSLHSSVSVPFGSFSGNVLLTREWTPLEPKVVDHKYYVKGVGEVAEVTARGPKETGLLVSVTNR